MAERQQPEERKVQFTGGSTYTVSLPKAWASEQGIEPGHRVHLYSRGGRLLIVRADHDDSRRTKRIDADARQPTDLRRTVIAAYVAGCEEIRVEGSLDEAQRRAVRDAVAGLVGIEVHEETETAVVARTMLDVADLSPEQTLVQMELTALSMHENAIQAALAGDAEEGRRIQRQDDDVDRLFGLICREFQQSLIDVRLSQGGNGLTTFEYYSAARQLERIADHAEKIATVAERVDAPVPPEPGEQLVTLGERSRQLVHQALSGILDGLDSTALEAALRAGDEIAADAATLDRELYDIDDGYLLGSILESIVRTAEYGRNVAEAGLQATMRDQQVGHDDTENRRQDGTTY